MTFLSDVRHFEPVRDGRGNPVIEMRTFLYGQVKIVTFNQDASIRDIAACSHLDPPRQNMSIVIAPGLPSLTVCKFEVDPIDYSSDEVRWVRVYFHRYVGMPLDTPEVDADNQKRLSDLIAEGHHVHFA